MNDNPKRVWNATFSGKNRTLVQGEEQENECEKVIDLHSSLNSRGGVRFRPTRENDRNNNKQSWLVVVERNIR
jgi:hypothetical protein